MSRFSVSWDESAVGGSFEIRVHVADTDLMGVVYNSNYLVYMEIGRTELLRKRGLAYSEVERRGISLPVIEARFRVRLSARYDDVLRVETRVGDLRSRSILFLYSMFRQDDLLLEGETLHVPLDHGEGKPLRFPSWIVDPMTRT